MKKAFIITLLAMALSTAFAQNGGIIHVDFEPDLCISSPNFSDTISIDFDQDGTSDYKVFLSWRSTGEIAIDMITSWEHRYKILDNDTIVPSEETYPSLHYWLESDYQWQHMFEDGSTHSEDYIGFRLTTNGEHYHAWARVYADIQYTSTTSKVWVYVDSFAFCMIPNYPLRWGQASLTENIDETEAIAFATLHPNPTSGIVTITGQDMRQAVVFNTLGQQVAITQGEGNELRIDMATLPTGVYFVNITDDEGRKCLRKVVKE